jgi:hypothetical protein
MLDIRLLVLCGALATGLVPQQPTGKAAPLPPSVEPDWKLGPTEPFVPPPAAARPRVGALQSPKALSRAEAGAAALLDGERVLFDSPEPGSIWVATARYKLGLARGTASFVPFLGSMAEGDHALHLRLRDLELGGRRLPAKDFPEPRRDGNAVEFDHGSFVMRYEARADGVEQSFRFDRLPLRGELVVRVGADTALRVEASGESLRFLGAVGGIDYGPALAFDAGGRRVAVERRWRDGAIEITVPEAFVADAKLPLVIDPVIGTVATVFSGTPLLGESDLCFSEADRRYTVCFELVYSATDTDVYVHDLDADGIPIAGSIAPIDVSTVSWQAPRIANSALSGRNLVVAQVSTGNLSPFVIRGRTRSAAELGPQFTVEDQTNSAGDKIRPDVGGDGHLAAPTYFTVVWERVFTTSDHDIHGVQLGNELTPVRRTTAPILFDNSGSLETEPQISNGAGAPIPDATAQWWTVVWRRSTSVGQIFASTLRWDGLRGSTYLAGSGDVLLGWPSVSTLTMPDAQGNAFALIAWEHGFLTDGGDTNDIDVVLCTRQGPVSPVYDLQVLEGDTTARLWDQFQPRVASDGCRFVVAYGDDYADSGDLDVRVTTLHALPPSTGGAWALGISEARAAPAFANRVETKHGLYAEFESHASYSGGPIARSNRYALSWHDAGATGVDNSIRFARYAGMRSFGGITTLPTGCGSATIVHSGDPALALTIRIASSGQALLVGVARGVPLPICSTCALGVDPFDSISPHTTLVVPCDPSLLGGILAFQGVKVASGEPCIGNMVSLTDTVLVQVR